MTDTIRFCVNASRAFYHQIFEDSAALAQEAAMIIANDQFESAGFRVIKLDEWLGLVGKDHCTYEVYWNNHTVDPLPIDVLQFISFDIAPLKPETECLRVRALIDDVGRIDLTILGIDINDRLSLNESSDTVVRYSHSPLHSSQPEVHCGLAGSAIDFMRG